MCNNVSNKIWLFHNINWEVEILLDHPQCLHCKISSPALESPFLFTIVYAKCTRRERRDLWDQLRVVSSNTLPWVVGGDFNIISSTTEREGGQPPDLNAMNDFNICQLDCGLLDIGFSGPHFTWQGTDIVQRLDRFLFNQPWLDKFKRNSVNHQLRRCSDHRPL